VEPFTPHFWLAALEIIFINILLSGDNAVVIALACRNLSKRQRTIGILWGIVGAVVLRVLLTFFALELLKLPYLQLVGAALLLWIGSRLIAEDDDGDGADVESSDKLISAVKTVILADLVMSLDNVIGVAGAAKGSVLLLVFGLTVSIPLVVLGAQIIMRLMERMPWLVLAGGGLLGYIAGEIAVEDAAVKDWVVAHAAYLHWVGPVAGVAIVVAAGTWISRRQRTAAPAD
jgi:YjbE family integral membrane protein